MKPTIKVEHVSHSFNKKEILSDINLTFQKGKIYALLGRNGVGKSTLINIISSRIIPKQGRVLINDEDINKSFNALSNLFCISDVEYFSPRQNLKKTLKFANSFYENFNIEQAYEYAKKFEIDIDQKFINLSTGQKSIFKIIIGLCVDVDFVIFDEPILGLDASYRDLFYQLLMQNYLAKENTFIISTHIIEEIANIVEEVIIINDKKILLHQTTEEMLEHGYSVSGIAEQVDVFCSGKNVLDSEMLGNLKISYVLGKRPQNGENLTISNIDLQKLFVKLTAKEVDNEFE